MKDSVTFKSIVKQPLLTVNKNLISWQWMWSCSDYTSHSDRTAIRSATCCRFVATLIASEVLSFMALYVECDMCCSRIVKSHHLFLRDVTSKHWRDDHDSTQLPVSMSNGMAWLTLLPPSVLNQLRSFAFAWIIRACNLACVHPRLIRADQTPISILQTALPCPVLPCPALLC